MYTCESTWTSPHLLGEAVQWRQVSILACCYAQYLQYMITGVPLKSHDERITVMASVIVMRGYDDVRVRVWQSGEARFALAKKSSLCIAVFLPTQVFATY